jgi:hypothetical protein
MRTLVAAAILFLTPAWASCAPIDRSRITIVDGDTIRVDGGERVLPAVKYKGDRPKMDWCPWYRRYRR